MVRLSANIGFLWSELSYPDRIRAAARAGFEAVECHFPYAHEPQIIRDALDETGLAMLSLNTQFGTRGADDFGVAARPGREAEARTYIDQALEYATAISCANVNITAGITGRAAGCEQVFRENLAYACEVGADSAINILIEPINERSVPGYHLSLIEQAIETMASVGAGNLRLLFDCFHTQIMHGDLTHRLRTNLDHIGHVQISAVPDRGEPDVGEVNYRYLLGELDEMGYSGWVGAEYHPRGSTAAGLGWLSQFKGVQ